MILHAMCMVYPAHYRSMNPEAPKRTMAVQGHPSRFHVRWKRVHAKEVIMRMHVAMMTLQTRLLTRSSRSMSPVGWETQKKRKTKPGTHWAQPFARHVKHPLASPSDSSEPSCHRETPSMAKQTTSGCSNINTLSCKMVVVFA